MVHRASRVLQISKSNTHDVTLVDVSRKLTGWYKCEVSASSPSYHTMIEKAKMEVVGKCTSIVKCPNIFLYTPFFFFLRFDRELRVSCWNCSGTNACRLLRHSIPKR